MTDPYRQFVMHKLSTVPQTGLDEFILPGGLFEHQEARPLRIAQRPFYLPCFYFLLIKGFYR